MSFIGDQLKALTTQLFPSGRAFYIRPGSIKEKLINGLMASEERFYNDAVSTFNSVLPDNPNFTADDATAWEKRLGLITNQLVPLQYRMDAIVRKINHPGTIKARQNYLYLQGQLQAAGFNVYVYENRFPAGYDYISISPTQFSSLPFPKVLNEHKTLSQHGQRNHGYNGFSNKIANRIELTGDDNFNIGTNYNFTFFIGGSTPGSWATVDVNREQEFRQLVLKIKPVQTIAFLLVRFY